VGGQARQAAFVREASPAIRSRVGLQLRARYIYVFVDLLRTSVLFPRMLQKKTLRED
jgi:hypothetical protein